MECVDGNELEEEMIKNYVTFVVDSSSSMQRVREDAIQTLKDLVRDIQKNAKERKQEAWIRFVTFSNNVSKGDTFKKTEQVMVPLYNPYGNTALRDAVKEALIPEIVNVPASSLLDDVAHLIVVITDGEENASRTSRNEIQELVKKADEKGNYSLVFNGPPYSTNYIVREFGVPQENVREWEASREGLLETVAVNNTAYSAYSTARSLGATKTVSYYAATPDLSQLDLGKLKEAKKLVGQFKSHKVEREERIDEFVERMTGKPYLKGTAFYQLTKPETVQKHKDILLREKGSSMIYAGPKVREAIGIPQWQDGKINPGNMSNWDLFVQSTSDNRKLVRGTTVLVAR